VGQRCGKVTGREQVSSGVIEDLRESPPSKAREELVSGELLVGELASRLEVGGADKKVVVDDAIEAGRMICADNYLMPDVRRIDGSDQAGFLSQLTAQRGQPVLTWFYAATWSGPDGLRPARDGRVGENEPAQQDTVVFVQDDRASGGSKVQRHGRLLILGAWYTVAAMRALSDKPSTLRTNASRPWSRKPHRDARSVAMENASVATSHTISTADTLRRPVADSPDTPGLLPALAERPTLNLNGRYPGPNAG
jgi:hypothetical protein